MILNLDDAPTDPVERLLWLSGVKEQVQRELDEEFARTYYEARIQKVFIPALSVGLHSRKKALAYARKENERRGRTVRWNDGLDPTSTAYSGN